MVHEQKPHFVLFIFMAQGHMIPMVDIARLLAKRGVIITILTTPHNAERFIRVVNRSIESGLDIHVHKLKFPCVEAGLPEGCENFDLVPSGLDDYVHKFFAATEMLREQVEDLLRELKPFPSCLISDMCFPWSTEVCMKWNIPRLVFHGTSCFALLCLYMVAVHKDFVEVASDTEYFVVPGLPDRIEITKCQLFKGSMINGNPELSKMRDRMRETEKGAFGTVANTFEELEFEYMKELRRVKCTKVWCIGPVSLCNDDEIDKVERRQWTSTCRIYTICVNEMKKKEFAIEEFET